LQQEIAEASDDASMKYYDETPDDERSTSEVTALMRAAAKTKHTSFKGQFSKFIAFANPKFGLQLTSSLLLIDHKALEQQWEAWDITWEVATHCNDVYLTSFQGQMAKVLEPWPSFTSSCPFPFKGIFWERPWILAK
jgi:hypothetical protein